MQQVTLDPVRRYDRGFWGGKMEKLALAKAEVHIRVFTRSQVDFSSGVRD